MNAAKNPFVVTRAVFAAAQQRFDCACEYANQLLQSALHTVEQDVLCSASYIATLEGELKILEAAGVTDMSSSTRYQIADATSQHLAFVEESQKRMQQAWEAYHGRISVAATALADASIWLPPATPAA